MQSLNGLLLLLRQADIGQKLYEMRERLQEEVRQLQEDQHWVESLDKKVMTALQCKHAVLLLWTLVPLPPLDNNSIIHLILFPPLTTTQLFT